MTLGKNEKMENQSDSPERTPADVYREQWNETDRIPDLAGFFQQHDQLSAHEMIDVLLVDQSMKWSRGQRTAVEEYLRDHPQIAAERELCIDLVYGEFRAQQALGVENSSESIAQRFPELKESLARQLEVASWMQESNEGEESAAQFDTLIAEPRDDVSPAIGPGLDPQAPLSLDDYELVEEVGVGAMGTVYRARQKSLNKFVAVKILKSHLSQSKGLSERFLREARAVASLRHPNIVGVHGVGRGTDRSYFLVMDFVEGANLHSRLQDGPVEIEEAMHITGAAAKAIAHAHEVGIIHRDLKPGNVMLDTAGNVLVMDFGLFKSLGGEELTLSIDGQIIGTPQYMAPEQANPRFGEIGPTTDVYGLGGLLYSLLVAKPPIEGDSNVQVLAQLISDNPPTSPCSLREDIPAPLEAICCKCLQKEPQDRYQSAQEVARALDEILALTESSERTREQTQSGVASRFPMAIAGSVLAVLILSAIIWNGFRGNKNAGNKNAPLANPQTVEAIWTVDVYRDKRRDQRERLSKEPAPIYTGDSIRMQIELSKPAFAYVYWIGSDASVQQLYPGSDAVDVPVSKVAIPAELMQGLPIEGAEGLEMCVVILRDKKLADPVALLTMLKPGKPLQIFGEEPFAIDDKSTFREIADDEETRKQLAKLQQGTRPLGSVEPLVDGPPTGSIAHWKQSLPPEIGSVRFVAVSHTSKPAPVSISPNG